MLQRVLKNEHVRKYFFNTGWMLAEKVTRVFAGAFVGIFVARYLGPSDYGILNYALGLVAIVLPIAGLGLGDILIRELMSNTSKEEDILGTALFLRLFGSFLILSIVFIITVINYNDWLTTAVIFLMSLSVVFQVSDVFDRYFQAKLKVRAAVQCYIIGLVVSSILKVVLLLLHKPLIYFAIAQLSESLIVSIAFLLSFKKVGRLHNFNFVPKLALRFVKESWVLIISGLMVVLSIRIDQVMIMDMLGAKELGNFSAAVKLTESFYFIAIAISNALYPAIIYGKSMGQEVFEFRLRRLYTLLTWIAIPIALMVSLLATPIAHIYGNKYDAVDKVLAVHIWAGIFVFWGVISTKWFIIEKLPYLITINTTVCAGLNVILNLFLIPKYGIVGSAVATLISQAVSNFFIFIIYPQTRGLFFTILRSLNFLEAFSRGAKPTKQEA